jgi:protein O-GlcNAc transferase
MSDVTLQQLLDTASGLHQAGKLEEAQKIYHQILLQSPDEPDVLHLLGVVRQQQGYPFEALELIGRAIAINPRQAAYHCNLGVVLSHLNRHAAAGAEFTRAIALRPDYFEAYFNLANGLKDTGRPQEAIAQYRRAQALCPQDSDAVSNMLFALHCVWDPDPAQIFSEHRQWDQRFAQPLSDQIRPHDVDRDPNRRLRIGYVSPDFREHSVGFFIESLLAAHDPSQFELFGYADLPRSDAITTRIQKLFHNWRNATGISDPNLSEMIRADKIDILIDLAGHTAGNRLLVFARKPAPIQINYLGYPDTTGMSAMDYRLTDIHADPPGMTEGYYSEKLLRMPRSFVCYRPPENAPEVSIQKKDYITFGSFNNLAKMNEKITHLWSQILKTVPSSRLLIKNAGLSDQQTREEFLQRFTSEGIEASRIDLRPQSPTILEHLKTYEEVDIALDTYPYNGTTTTCEAMWMGVPVVTLVGTTHAARVGLSLLTNVNLTELAADSPQGYVKLAANIPDLSQLRASLRQRMNRSPLLDGPGFAREVEAQYRKIWRSR